MLGLYEKYYGGRDYEQLDLFALLVDQIHVKSAVYPGSFVQISPSFFITDTCYIDSDKQAKGFFADMDALRGYVRGKAKYREDVKIRFYPQDYTQPVEELGETFDLLISQYAGFISGPCKRYLRQGGLLLVNNSHGDAGIAALDADYALAGVFEHRDNRYIFSDENLESYFIPKKKPIILPPIF